ncbi:MAG: phosphopantothenoylcysteine decarboxylase / phosphopantothenate---cysteine ligase [Clostridia bacterium]|nr:phosphopantothenoylcysteine decarboxylase / phosphopantothenate---cysteine ligase [Clostridia bacterium]
MGQKEGMKALKGKTVILGITGGIAAYKGAELCRLLIQEGATVQVVMTQAAQQFITPLTFSTITGQETLTETFASDSQPLKHIELANKADLFLVAPATANIIAKFAMGLADDLLSTTALVINCPALVAPAMNVNMYAKTVVQENLSILKRRGWKIIEPEEGFLACGTSGKGRLANLESIVAACRQALLPSDFEGQKVLVTAGGTREPLDPVRYIGNYSSGKMGYALAQAAKERGAEVTLISTSELPPPPEIDIVRVQTAAEMLAAIQERFSECDIVIKAAAVADFRPGNMAEQKIKKGDHKELNLSLEPTPDILANLSKVKEKQLLIGFAAETQDLLQNAKKKLDEKNLDLIVANDVNRKDAGFGSETNVVTLLYPDGHKEQVPKMPKLEVAHRILDAIRTLPGFKERN